MIFQVILLCDLRQALYTAGFDGRHSQLLSRNSTGQRVEFAEISVALRDFLNNR